jgi:hypothetical protein
MSADERDDVVARALGSLPVPEHRPGFWERVDGAMEAIDAQQGTGGQHGQGPEVDATATAEVHDLTAAARRFPRRYQMLSAAAVVAVVLAGVAVLDRGTGRKSEGVDRLGDSTTPTNVGRPDTRQLGAVQDWSRAIDDGDAERAWDLMGPDSQAYLRAQGGWDRMVAEMAEGAHAAWSRTENVRWEARQLDPASAVVTASGELELEGMREYRTEAYPVVTDAKGVWKVEPFAFGPGDSDAEFVNPPLGENGLGGVGPEAVIEVDVISGSKVFVFLDGGGLESMKKQGERRWSYDPPGRLSNGTHQVIVVTRGATWFTAHVAEFAVEG